MKKIRMIFGLAVVASSAGPCSSSVMNFLPPQNVTRQAHLLANTALSLRALKFSQSVIEKNICQLQELLPHQEKNASQHKNSDLWRQIQEDLDLKNKLRKVEDITTAKVGTSLNHLDERSLALAMSTAQTVLAETVSQGGVHVLKSVMMGGKSQKLYNIIYDLKQHKTPFSVFFPRSVYGKGAGVSRAGQRFDGQPIDDKFSFAIYFSSHPEIRDYVIDEMHFLNKHQTMELGHLSLLGRNVIAAGLAASFNADPFWSTNFLAMLDQPSKDTLCHYCGKDWATHHLRVKSNKSQATLNVGQDKFTSVCFPCWLKDTFDDKDSMYWLDHFVKMSTNA